MGAAVVTDYTPDTKVISADGYPTLLCRWKVEMPCKCAVWIGIRLDNQEPATAGIPCWGLHHERMQRFNHHGHMQRFNEEMAATLEHPTDRPLVDVVEEVLNRTFDSFPSGVHRR